MSLQCQQKMISKNINIIESHLAHQKEGYSVLDKDHDLRIAQPTSIEDNITRKPTLRANQSPICW